MANTEINRINKLNKYYSQTRSSVSPLPPPPSPDPINEFIVQKLNLLALLISDSSLKFACVMSCEFTCEAVTKFLPAQSP